MFLLVVVSFIKVQCSYFVCRAFFVCLFAIFNYKTTSSVIYGLRAGELSFTSD